jgi:preprotein translocase subunit YajC
MEGRAAGCGSVSRVINPTKGRDRSVESGAAVNLLFLVFIFAIFYFMLIRPQKRRVEQHRRLIESIRLGDEIVTIGGLYGVVRGLGDDEIRLEVGDDTTVRIVKSAVARRVTEDVEDEAGDAGQEESS